jgi:hypothetical protein
VGVHGCDGALSVEASHSLSVEPDTLAIQAHKRIDDLLMRPAVERSQARIGGQRLVDCRVKPDVFEPSRPVLRRDVVIPEIVEKPGQASLDEMRSYGVNSGQEVRRSMVGGQRV